MTTRVDKNAVEFNHGEPKYPYDEVYRCFSGDHNGLLFRLVETVGSKKKWSFYNDTVDTIVKVRTTFKSGSSVEPLRGASMSSAKNTETGEVETIVEAEVWPCMTHQFIEGVPNGFEIEFQTEAAPAEDVEFENGKPKQRYDKIYKCFKNSGNGLFFRLVDERSGTWYFHNDTQGYSMVATVEFADREAAHPLGNTQEVGVPEENPNGVILSITVPPLSTEPFVSGSPSNYRMSFSADPVNNDQPEDPDSIEYRNAAGPDAGVVDVPNAKVYRCFKQNKNGLLFRIVDEANNLWAYYNDTENYLMTATVKIPLEESFEPSEHAQVSEDPEDATVVVVTMQVPPLETLPFIYGNPHNFETSYSAVSANTSAPEDHPDFRNGQPDRSIMDYDQVTKVVKQQDSDDAILYRLFDTKSKKWGFYNDSLDVTVVARVKFNDGAKIRKLGDTHTDSDVSGASNGIYYVTEVKPLETMEFIVGDYTSFESKFAGTRKIERKAE